MPFRLSLLLLLTACTRPAQPVRDPTHPDLRLDRVAIRSWSDNRLRVLTTATRLDVFREIGTPGDVIAWDAGVLLLTDGTQLTAPLVTGNLFAGQFTGKGGVTLSGPNSLRAATETVAFDRAQGAGGVAASDAGLVLTQPGLRLEATGFSFDVAEERATFEQARTRFAP
ncbi:MAG: hypothetical protein Q8L48_12085 [Archangium sp.]|nr:hypothetical protein [Archangium sp.]